MHFAIDVDQTICGSNAHEVYALFHNLDLQLGIDQLTISRLTSYTDFLQLPQVRTFYQAHPKEWNTSRHRAIMTPEVLYAFAPIKDAVAGVECLSERGTVGYYTARSLEVKDVTQCWLGQHCFCESHQVICCSNIEQKLRTLAQYEPREESIVLIDDRGHTHVLSMLDRLKDDTSIQALVKRLTILAFGATAATLPETTCSLFALPAWGQLQTVLSLFT